MLEYLYSIIGIGGLAAAVWFAIQMQKVGASKAKIDQAEKEKSDAIKAAQSAINRPRTRNDRIKRLRSWRDKLR